MTDENAFLRAILEHPDDEAPRLVYADWLEERGNLRGEFIRIQCELARQPPHDPRRIELEVREWQLLDAQERAWIGRLRGWLESWQFRRGFVEEITLSAGNFLDHASDIVQGMPIRAARLLNAADLVPQLASCPQLARLARLDLSGNRLGNPGAQLLAVSPFLVGLTTLNLRDNDIGDAGVQALASSPHLVRLTTLDLTRNPIGPMALDYVGRSPHLGRHAPLTLHFDAIASAAKHDLQSRFGARFEFR